MCHRHDAPAGQGTEDLGSDQTSQLFDISLHGMLDLGTPTAIELTITPANLTVLSPAVGQASVAKTVTLTNGGTVAVTGRT